MEIRICKKCGIKKTLNEFNKNYNKKYNKYYFRYKCKDCEKEYSKNNANKHKKWIKILNNMQKNRWQR